MLTQERQLGKVFVEENLALSRLNALLEQVSVKYNMNYQNIFELLKRRDNYASIPASLFNNKLGPLENVVYYLHLKFNLTQTEIAKLLQRDHTTIWTTLENAERKIGKQNYSKFIFNVAQKKDDILIPLSTFSDRKLSVLEHLSIYLKDICNLNYHQIALVTGKDDRTIWTVVNRGRKKLKGK